MEYDKKHFGFSPQDTPHGLAKRRILKSYLSSFFARGIERTKYDHNRWSKYSSTYAVAYVDGFSFRGEYTSDAPVTRFRPISLQEGVNEDISFKGSPIIALDRALDILKNSKEQRLEHFDFQIFQTCHFVFNDIKKDNIKNLYKLAQQVFKRYGWEKLDDIKNDFPGLKENPPSELFASSHSLSHSNFFTYEYYDSDMLETYGKLWAIRMSFINDEFMNCPCPIADKVFSFIDPCGIKEIPLEVIDKFLGPGKEVFINLMVLTIRRVSANPIGSSAICNLFGSKEAAEAVKELSGTQSKDAYQKYVSIYERQIQNLCHTDSPNSVHFCFSKSKRDKDTGDLFFMVYCNYYFNDIEVELGRKTTNQEEADAIFSKFKGRKLTLAEVKLWIVYKSPYTFHSRALGLLEKNMTMKVHGAPMNRRKGDFDSKILDPTLSFGSNNWTLEFLDSKM